MAKPGVNIIIDIDANRIKQKYSSKNDQAVKIIKSEIVKDTDPYVPQRERDLKNSVIPSVISSRPRIIYAKVYSRFLYYGKVMVGKISRKTWANKGETKETINKKLTYSRGGEKWFENSKKKNMEKWLRIVKKLYK